MDTPSGETLSLHRSLFTNGRARGRNTPARRLQGPRHLLLLTTLLSALYAPYKLPENQLTRRPSSQILRRIGDSG